MVWSEEPRKLSHRLQIMADKVRPGESIADVGTDHGYLPLYLYEKGISPRVVLTDISEASLAKAKSSFGAGQFGNDVSFRVGDGLDVLGSGEVDVVVIAGMGGLLIRDILSADLEKTRSYKRLVLQPRTAAGPLRKWLLEYDFVFLSEDVVEEGDFLPEIMTVAPKGEDLAEGIRETLSEPDVPDIHFDVPIWMMKASGPVGDHLDRRVQMYENTLTGLKKAKAPDERAIDYAEYSIDYLSKMRELWSLLEERREEEEE